MLKKLSSYASFLILLISYSQSYAQGQGSTPYSVFGIGELAEPTDAVQDMMGGAGSSFSNGFYVNLVNPALVVKNRMVGEYKYVAFNVGLKGNYRNLVQGDQANTNFGYNLQNLTLSFPASKTWAMAVALRPYSMVDYTTTTQRVISNEQFNNVNSHKGGISRVSYINSISLFNNLFLGIEGSYNFGVIYKDSTQYLASNGNQQRNSTRLSTKGASLKLGAAYQQKLSKKWRLNLGGSVETRGKLNTEVLNTFAIYNDTGNGPALQTVPDTLSLASITSNSPAQMKFGVSLESPYHWIFAADYGITKWSNANAIDDISQRFLKDSKDLSLGIEWLPNSTSTKYLNQVFYRVGFASSTTPYNINGAVVKDNRFSAGLSLPMGFRNPSYINLGVALGRRGVNDNNLVQENYVRISTSFSLLSPWFIKPKID